MDRIASIPDNIQTKGRYNHGGEPILQLLVSHWFAVFCVVWSLWVFLPFAAPVFMHLGWIFPARLIYWFYSFQCHQLPQRSFFLFGNQFTHSLAEIQAAFQNTDNPALLRQFIGNSTLGWKVAWSDRMVSMYTSTLLFGLFWWVFRRKIRPIPLWGLVLFLIPMGIDGGSHLISDLSGIGQGFRYTNTWLAVLTRQALPAAFYAGDAWGSFNSIMRLFTGLLFGLGLVWYALPQLEQIFRQTMSLSFRRS